MKKNKIGMSFLSVILVLTMTACAAPAAPQETQTETPKTTEAATEKTTETVTESIIEPFYVEYVVEGSGYTGPYSDTYIFEGETTDGVITTLNFDIIRDKGTEKEYSKKSIMGYVMNISDAVIVKEGDVLKLTLSCNGYDTKFGEGNSAQFMLSASAENLTEETTFKDLVVFNVAAQTPCPAEQAVIAYQYLAKENGIAELTADTLVKDLLVKHGLYDGTAFVEGSNRVSFAGFNGGRSYGEQLDSIVEYIVSNEMTLEEVAEMFLTVNQQATPIEERDLIAGATISFTGDFQKMAYLAAYGELPEGVLSCTEKESVTDIEVLTQGYGGSITAIVSIDADGQIAGIVITKASESDGIGAVLTEPDSEFIQTLIAGQGEADAVSGATVTSEALKKTVKLALEYYSGI